MTPDELKQIALNATKKEYELIIVEMKAAASKGSFTCRFPSISDGAKQQLTDAGFDVVKRNQLSMRGGSPTYYEVKFAK